MPFPAPAGLKTQNLIIHVYPFSLVIVTKLKDILVKSCTLQKSETHLDLHKILCRQENYGLLHEVPTPFPCIHRLFNAGVKSLLPWGSPWGGRGGCFGACHKSRLNCMLFVVCAMWSVNDIKREVYKS